MASDEPTSSRDPRQRTVGEVLKEILRSKGMKPAELSRLSGRSSSGVSQILNGKIVPTLETILEFEVVLDLPRGTLARHAGYRLDDEVSRELSPMDQLVQALARFDLTDRERRYVRETVEHFLQGHNL